MEEEELELDFDEDDLFQQQSLENQQQTYQRSPTPPRPHDSTLDANGNKLPPNWESRISSTKGDIYYKNLVNSKSSWEIPIAELPVVRSRDVTTPPLPVGMVKPLNRSNGQEGSQRIKSNNNQREDSSSQPTSKFRSDPNFSEAVAPYSPVEVQSSLSNQKSTQPPLAPRGKQAVPGAPTGPKALVPSNNNYNRKGSREISPPPADAPVGPRRATNYLISNNATGNGGSTRASFSSANTTTAYANAGNVAVEVNHHTVISGPNDWGRRAAGGTKVNRDEGERDGGDREAQPPSGPKNPKANPIPKDQLYYKNQSYPPGPKSFSNSNSTKFEKKLKRGPANLSDLDAELNFHASQRSPRSRSRSPPPSRRRSRSRSRSPPPPPSTSNYVSRPKYRPGFNNSGLLPPRSPPPEIMTDAAMATMRQTLVGRHNLAIILETQERKLREKASRDAAGNGGREKSPIIASAPIVPPGGNNWARVKDDRARERSLSPPRGKRPEYREERRRSRSRSPPPPPHSHHQRQRSLSPPPRHSRRPRSLSPPPPRHTSSRNFRDRSPTPPPRRRQISRSRSPPPPPIYRTKNYYQKGIIDTYRPERRQQDTRDFRGGEERFLVKSQGELSTGRGVVTSGKGMYRVTKDDPLLNAIPMSVAVPQQESQHDNKIVIGNGNFRDRKRSRSRSPPPHLVSSSAGGAGAGASLASRMNSSLPDRPNTLGARLGFDNRKRNKGE